MLRLIGSIALSAILAGTVQAAPKKVYLSFILHGNMNYDRYPKETIWKKFPIIYQNVVDFLKSHPDFKGQMQLSGQTFKTLQQVSPNFLQDALKLRERGQIDFTGTFYSEPVNVCMDGESNLLTARLGTGIIRQELGSPSGFFLQEHAWNPQLPWVLTQAGVDWTPIRMSELRHRKPFYAVGLDGTRIPAVEEYRDGALDLEELYRESPADGLVLVVGDYEIPSGFVQAYNEVERINKAAGEIRFEWVRVRDFLAKHPVTEEEFVDNSKMCGIPNWDSYSRWTADPLDILVHTETKAAMAALRAAKLSVVLGSEFARLHGIAAATGPDISADRLETGRPDREIDWNIEHTTDYPDVEPKYLARDGRVSALSRAEHLMAWGVNSDSRGWWPLYERRVERMTSLKQVVAISNEIMAEALTPIGTAISRADFDRAFLFYNAEKEREAEFTFETGRPYLAFDTESNPLESRIERQGNSYRISVRVSLPAYGYRVIGLKEGGDVANPAWETGSSIKNGRLALKSDGLKTELAVGDRTVTLSLDPFQLRLLAEMPHPRYPNIAGWHDVEPFGTPRVTVCQNGLYPKLRIDYQVDWAVHLRQEYMLRRDCLEAEWRFTFAHPTMVRKVGKYENFTDLFRPEGLMARLETGRPGEIYYDVPYGVATHDVDGPSYVCALNFTILQQQAGGVMLTAKTGSQAIAVDGGRGSLGLTLGASTPSGPIHNPYYKIDGLEFEHEEPWYLERFQGTYTHRFVIYPFAGRWEDIHASARARGLVNDVYTFELPNRGGSARPGVPGSASLLSLEPDGIEVTCMERLPDGIMIRLNERERKSEKGRLRVGKMKADFEIGENGIKELTLK